MKNKGFNLVEILLAMAILAMVFSFIFYFISSIQYKKSVVPKAPFIFHNYHYSSPHCSLNEGQLDHLSIVQDLNMSLHISTSTPITGMHLLDKDRLVLATNSSSTTEPDIFVFEYPSLIPIQKLDIGPGISGFVAHSDLIYALNTSVNSHVKTLRISEGGNMAPVGDSKIQEISASHALPKKAYLTDTNLLVGTEKNADGGELFVLPLDGFGIPQLPTKSLEIGGQVSGMYVDQNLLYIGNASDIELLVYDERFSLAYSYDAPLSLGNGKSVFHLEPYVYLGRTVASFELFFLEIKDSILNYIDKFKVKGTVDFIQPVGSNILILSNAEDREMQFFNGNLDLLSTVNLPSRVNAYACLENSFLLAVSINDQSHILWLK